MVFDLYILTRDSTYADIKKPKPEENQVDTSNIQAQNFTFRELAIATKNFRQECLMGEGGFGRVYKGTIPATGQVINKSLHFLFISAEKTQIINKSTNFFFHTFKCVCVCVFFHSLQVIAVKQLDRNGVQGSKEFLVEVLMLSLLNHENLVKLIGYCADGDQRLLVYEFMPGGSLEGRLLGTYILLTLFII